MDLNYGINGFSTLGPFSIGASVFDMALLSNGKLLVTCAAGYGLTRRIMVARLNINGTADSTFGVYGICTSPIDSGKSFKYSGGVIQKDGKIIVAVTATNVTDSFPELARFTANGKVDSTFGEQGIIKNIIAGQHSDIVGLALQSDGGIIVAGSYPNPIDIYATQTFLARYTSHYAPATDFSATYPPPAFTLFPNPTTSTFTLSAPNTTGNTTVTVCNMLGKTVYVTQHNFTANLSINIAQQPEGMYFVKVTNSQGMVQVVRFLKQ